MTSKLLSMSIISVREYQSINGTPKHSKNIVPDKDDGPTRRKQAVD